MLHNWLCPMLYKSCKCWCIYLFAPCIYLCYFITCVHSFYLTEHLFTHRCHFICYFNKISPWLPEWGYMMVNLTNIMSCYHYMLKLNWWWYLGVSQRLRPSESTIGLILSLGLCHPKSMFCEDRTLVLHPLSILS